MEPLDRPPNRSKVELDDQEQGEEEEEEEMDTEEDTPLVALPEERPSATTDVSAGPTFQCLDEVRPPNVVE